MLNKQQIIEALRKWINQRPGLEFGNYGDWTAYRSELRSIARDRKEALELLRAVEWRDGITAEHLIAASKSAYGGRLTIEETWRQHEPDACPGRPCGDHCDHREHTGVRISYVTGQYWPTEYRRAACAVLASALRDHARECMPAAQGTLTRRHGPFVTEHDNIEGMTPGDWLREHFRREFGRGIASRWFN